MKNLLKKEVVVAMADKANKSLYKISGLWNNAKSQINDKLKKKEETTEK